MSKFCKYYKERKQVSYDGGITWSDVVPLVYHKGDLYEANSTSCGAVEMERWVNSGTTCSGASGYDKYSLQVKQVSYDGGITWETTQFYKLGDLIEENSLDCGYYYRTISTGYTCVGYDKYRLIENQVTYDSGATWVTTSTTTGDLVETNSSYCGYVCPKKWTAYYEGGRVYSECCCTEEELDAMGNFCTYIRTQEINPYIPNEPSYGQYANLNYVEIGDCVVGIADHAFCYIAGHYVGYPLSGVSIPNSVTEIGWGAFDGCDRLKSIVIPDSVTRMEGRTFVDCSGLTSVKIGSGITELDSLEFVGCKSLRSIGSTGSGASVEIPYTVSAITSSAFTNCTGLLNVEIPSSVTFLENCFRNCYSLSSVTIPNSVTTIGKGTFYNCYGLPSINISDGVTSIGEDAFYNCSGLTNVNIGSGVTSIGNYAFEKCKKLSAITIPDNVTSIGDYVFSGCTNLEYIYISNPTPPTLGMSAFTTYAANLSNPNNSVYYAPTIVVPCEYIGTYINSGGNWGKYSKKITCLTPEYQYRATYSGYTTYSKECDAGGVLVSVRPDNQHHPFSAMTKLDIGDCIIELKYQLCEPDYGSTSILKEVNFPTYLEKIGNRAFFNCSKLIMVILPSTVTSIGDSAFYGCSGLSNVTINATTPPTLGNYVFNNTNDCTIYVPYGSVEEYKSAPGWSDYASRIRSA